MSRVTVDVHHLARVEGHGNIVVRIEDGELKEARWDVVESPRFFEVMLKGKDAASAAELTSRICGICAIGPARASLRAREDAFGVLVPPAARAARLLAKHAETIQSHALHAFFLAAPDFVGTHSVLPLLETHPAVVGIATRLRNFGNRLSDVIAGRTTHPVSLVPGGLARLPNKHKLAAMQLELPTCRKDLEDSVELFATLSIPDFVRETEFVSLKGGPHYPWIGGRLVSTDGVDKPERDYKLMTNEFTDKNNTSKWCKVSRDSMAVGALARLNNNFQYLVPAAKHVAERFGLNEICHNPYMNTPAQLVELVQVVEESDLLISELLDAPRDAPAAAEVRPKAGYGVGAVEVPRGILYHGYEYDDEGRVVRADCVIPTTQNNLNIHLDMGALVRERAKKGVQQAELEKLCSMLVRAYDPCISCSVH